MGITESTFRKSHKDGEDDGKSDTELWVSIKAKTTDKRTRAVHKKKIAFRASEKGMLIGSAPDCDLRLDDPNLAAQHALVQLNDKGQVCVVAFERTYFLLGQGNRNTGVHPIVKDHVVKMGACSLQVTETCTEPTWKDSLPPARLRKAEPSVSPATGAGPGTPSVAPATLPGTAEESGAGSGAGAGAGESAEHGVAERESKGAEGSADRPAASPATTTPPDGDAAAGMALEMDGTGIIELDADEPDTDEEEEAPTTRPVAESRAIADGDLARALEATEGATDAGPAVLLLENEGAPAPPPMADDADPGMCYICFDDSSEEGNELVHSPCPCAKLVHRQCLSKWIATKGSRLCSICKGKLPINFTVNPPYVVLQVVRHMRGLHWSGEREYIISFFQRRSNLVTIGSGDDCDLVLPDPSLSRNHSRILFRDDTFYVEDLMSSAGTFLRVAQPHVLTIDVLHTFKLGRTSISVKVREKRSLLRWRASKKPKD